jgi:hypothetical protein
MISLARAIFAGIVLATIITGLILVVLLTWNEGPTQMGMGAPSNTAEENFDRAEREREYRREQYLEDQKIRICTDPPGGRC